MALPIACRLQCAVGVDRSRQPVVGKTDLRTDEDAVFYGYLVTNTNIILDFDVTADRNPGIDKLPLSQDAVLPDAGAIHYLSVVPDAGTFTDTGLFRNFGCWMNLDRHG